MTPDAEATLRASGIHPEAAARAGVRYEPDASRAHPSFSPRPALVFPYHAPDGAPYCLPDGLPYVRVRYMDPPLVSRGWGRAPRPQRYAQPPGSPVAAYFPMVEGLDWAAVCADASRPVVLTEGEKKAISGCLASAPTIGLGGVWNWRGEDGLCMGLSEVQWRRRPTYVCFDSDAATNADIQLACARLAEELGQRRGADIYVVDMPPGPDGAKQGLDDYIVAHGSEAWLDLLDAAQPSDMCETAVLALNSRVAWLEEDACVYDLEMRVRMPKHSFVAGSRHSPLHILRKAKKGDGLVKVSVPEVWLTHPRARRHTGLTMDPASDERIVTTPTGSRLNLWDGWGPAEPAPDVAEAYERLTEHVTAMLPADVRDFPVKLLAWKFQNPAQKPGIMLVCTGGEGSGKSLWARAASRAAGKYGATPSSKSIIGDFHGWLERALIAVWDEANPRVAAKAADRLRSFVTEKTLSIDDKYVVARDVPNYTMFILTSNESGVGGGAHDDRRRFVWNVPASRLASEFYRRFGEMLDTQRGAEGMLHYFLTYPLAGWSPPGVAPMTQAKSAAAYEAFTPAQLLAAEMRDADHNTVLRWLDAATAWFSVANATQASSAQRVVRQADSLSGMPVRPWYSAEELAVIFPSLMHTLYGSRSGSLTPQALSRDLRDAGVPFLRSADPRGFMWRGRYTQFLVVADWDDWSSVLSQAEFDRAVTQFPLYMQCVAQRLTSASKSGKVLR